MLSDSLTDCIQPLQSKQWLEDSIQGTTAPAAMLWEAARVPRQHHRSMPPLPPLRAFGFHWDVKARPPNLHVQRSHMQNLKRFPVF